MEEEVKYRANPKMFKENPIGFILSVILILAFGLGIIILLAWYLKCKATELIITEDKIIERRGLVSKETSEFKISNIRTVNVNQSLQERMFDTANIKVYTAGDKPEIEVRGLPDPRTIKALLGVSDV